MEEKIKVSVIVPVYNVPEKALRDCIESCVNQTLREIEIILVDDGSTDNSGTICDEYASNDTRIKVIHKANEGLSAARNTGYRIANGEWITFLDGDDWIECGTCKENYEIGTREDTDIVIFGTIQEFGHYKNLFKYHYEDGTKFVGEECKELQCEILNFTGNIATAWAKLIKKEILERYTIEHNEVLRQGSEGIEFNIRLFEHINSAYFTTKVYYHYIYNPNSISAKHDEKNHYFVIRCFEEIRRWIDFSRNRERLEELFYNRFCYTIISAAVTGYFSPTNKVGYALQKKGYKKYLAEKIVSDTLAKTNVNKLDMQRKIIYSFIKHRFFIPIKVLALIRYIQKHRR